MWQQWVNFVAGLWLIASAFMAFSASAVSTNLIVTGIIVAVLGLWGAIAHTREADTGVMRRHA